MRFVLTYSGLLPSSGDAEDKHRIRRELHTQLARQWQLESPLSALAESSERINDGPTVTWVEKIASQFPRGRFRFVPLVTRRFSLVCYLEIVMLRREEPGHLIRHGGDIDNRMKTLFDSLRVPEESQLAGLSPSSGEDPFYCLLEDDSLVTGFQVKTERLLEPETGTDAQWGVRLLITAVVRPTKVTLETFPFLGGWL